MSDASALRRDGFVVDTASFVTWLGEDLTRNLGSGFVVVDPSPGDLEYATAVLHSVAHLLLGQDDELDPHPEETEREIIELAG